MPILPQIPVPTAVQRLGAARSDIRTIAILLVHFHQDTGRFPTTAEGLAPLSRCPTDLRGKWQGPYVKGAIANDPWGHPYVYASKDPLHFRLVSYGADGKPGGKGDAADLIVTGP